VKLELLVRRAKVVNQDSFKINQVLFSVRNAQEGFHRLIKDKQSASHAFQECTLIMKYQLHAKSVR
jgi:hypothetical protein